MVPREFGRTKRVSMTFRRAESAMRRPVLNIRTCGSRFRHAKSTRFALGSRDRRDLVLLAVGRFLFESRPAYIKIGGMARSCAAQPARYMEERWRFQLPRRQARTWR